MPQMIQYTRPDGQPVAGWWHEAEQPLGAVVVLQEWWGLNDQIRGVARRMAQAGFSALVPDLYRGKSTVEAEEASHLMNALDFADAAGQDIRGAVQHLKSLAIGGGKVAISGTCMGGALALLAAGQVAELDACVTWYGYPPLDYIAFAGIRAPVLAHWAEQDAFFDIAQVAELERRLAAAGVRYQGHRYLAHHAFANETAQGPGRLAQTQYDAAWAQLAWDRTLVFLGAQLGR